MKKLGILVLAAMLLVIIVYFVKPGSWVKPDNAFTKGKEAKNGDIENPKETMVSTDEGVVSLEEANSDEEKIPKENYFNMSETVEVEGIQYTVKSYRVTKEKGSFPIEASMKWPEYYPIDGNGNMTGDASYIIIDVFIQNVSNEEQIVAFINNGVEIRDENGKSKYEVSGLRSELKSFTGSDSDTRHQDWIYHLAPGDTYEGELAYIEMDEMLKDSHLEFVIKPSGMYGYNENTRCIRLNNK